MNAQQALAVQLMGMLDTQEGAQQALNLLTARYGGWQSHEEMVADLDGSHSDGIVRSTDNRLEFNGGTHQLRVVFGRVYDESSDSTISPATFLIDVNGQVFI